MKLKFVSELFQIASLRFIEALERSKITPRSFFLVLFATQKTLIISVGLQQLFQIERVPAV